MAEVAVRDEDMAAAIDAFGPYLTDGEPVLWAGRSAPARKRTGWSDWAEVLSVMLLSAVGAGGLVLVWPLEHYAPVVGFLLLMIASLWPMTLVRKLRKPRGQDAARYALTDRRLLLAGGDGGAPGRSRWVTSYALRHLPAATLTDHGDGTGTIEISPLADPDAPAKPRRRRRGNQNDPSWDGRPDPVRRLERIPDAAGVLRMLHTPHRRHTATTVADGADPSQSVPHPDVRPVLPSGLTYGSPVTEHLRAGEWIVWYGQPKQGVVIRWDHDPFAVPFGFVWLAGTLQFERAAALNPCPAVVGLFFVAVGVYLSFGRFIMDYYRRQRTWYALTNRRILIVSGTRPEDDVTFTPPAKVPRVDLIRHRDGTGSIFFVVPPRDRPEPSTWHLANAPEIEVMRNFMFVSEPDAVYGMVCAAQLGRV